MDDRAHLQLSRRKARDRSIALLIAGTVVLTPPVAGISLIEGTIAGIPVPLAYVFVVWILLIAGAAVISGPLRESDDATSSPDSIEPED